MTYALRETRNTVPSPLPALMTAHAPPNAHNAQRARIPGPRSGPRPAQPTGYRVSLASAGRRSAVAAIGIQAVQELLRDVEQRQEIRIVELPGDHFLERAGVRLPG